MFLAYLVGYFTQLCPRPFVPPALIMLGGKAQSVIQIGVIENDVRVDMGFITMNGKHILIIAFQKSVAQILSDLQGLFGSHFIGGKALYQVICEDLCPPCSSLSDGSEIFACS